MSQQQTLQQKRAAHAWQCIEKVDRNHKNDCKKYGSLVRGLPAMIQGNGLATSLAFLLAKGKKEHELAYEHLASWLKDEFPMNGQDLMIWLLAQPSPTYRQVMSESLAYLTWLKRFAEAKGWNDEQA
jgi:CRISPR-associated protein Cmr5